MCLPNSLRADGLYVPTQFSEGRWGPRSEKRDAHQQQYCPPKLEEFHSPSLKSSTQRRLLPKRFQLKATEPGTVGADNVSVKYIGGLSNCSDSSSIGPPFREYKIQTHTNEILKALRIL